MSVLLLVGPGCGGASTLSSKLPAPRPLSASEAALFDNGLDWVADPTQLSGRWREDWEGALKARTATADAVLVVEVTTVRTDLDPEQRRTYRLQADVRDTLFGSMPDDTLLLAVREGDEGFGTLHGRERRVLSRRFVLFLRRVPAESGTGASWRWHLLSAAPAVLERVKRQVALRTHTTRQSRRRRIVVH